MNFNYAVFLLDAYMQKAINKFNMLIISGWRMAIVHAFLQ